MSIKSKIKKILRKCKVTVNEPVYIPLLSGELLKGKTVLVTGGTGGIGQAIADRCIQNGANVIITGRNQKKLSDLAEKIGAIPFVLDIQNVADIETSFDELIQKYKVDILINNAGTQAGNFLGNTDEKDFDKTLSVNLKGTYFCCQVFSNYLIKNGIKGNILNISSVSGCRPAISPYMVSKWGITGLTEGLAKKLIKYGIVVNGIAPGPVATEMIKSDGSDLNYENAPAGRYSDPNEIANLAVFLISDMGRMIVGDTVYITGGCGNLTFDDIKY